MSLWLTRAGSHGEYENRFLDENRIYLTWENLSYDLSKVKTRQELDKLLTKVYPQDKHATIRNWASQIWPFVYGMKVGDWIVLPSKLKPATIDFAEVTGPYKFSSKENDPFYHSRTVKWIAKDVPRSIFDQDILFSFGAFKTICHIERNDAEKRVHAIAEAGWKSPRSTIKIKPETKTVVDTDLELLARDQIAELVNRKFKGHGLARLVEAILRAQGYTTYLSPEGPDKGIDILAALGPLGFGTPRICVQVKSGDVPVDSPTLNQLIGSMQNVQAEQGLLVSWSGFKSSVDKEIPPQFFRVRLWDQATFIEELLTNYDKLDEDIRADIPLKRIWMIADVGEQE